MSEIKGRSLDNHIIRSVPVINEDICQSFCYLDPGCVSYNYGPTEGIGTPLCELNDRTHLDVTDNDFIWKYGYSYRYIRV